VVHYVMVSEGVYPIAATKDCHSGQLKIENWLNGTYLDINVPGPILYDLEEDEYDEVPNVRTLSKGMPIPYMRNDLYDALVAVGVDNLQVFDAVIRDLKRGLEYENYKSFNIVGKVSAADMDASSMMGTSDTTMVGADFDRLVMDESKCQDLLLFRLAENITAIIVDEVVKNEIEKRGIEGVFFYPSGEWAG